MVYESGTFYHIFNRGAHGQVIFETDENYRYCLDLLRIYSQRYLITIHAYCLMPNHYHLLVKQGEGGSIRYFLQTTFNAYTQAFNKVHLHSGTMFQGRAKGKEISSDLYALRLSWYIHRNPVKAKLVTHPGEWEYSDYKVWMGTEKGIVTDLSLRDGYFMNGSQYRIWCDEKADESVSAEFLFDE